MPYTNTETGTLAGSGGLIGGAQGAVLASAASITVTDFIHEVSGSAAISTISGGVANKIYVLVPSSGATWTLATGGNINEAVTPDGHPVLLVYDGTTFFVASNGGVANYVKKAGDTMTGALTTTALTVSGASTLTGGVTGGLAVTGDLTASGSGAYGGATAASAILNLTSTSKGLLPPRMTYAQKTAIGSPATGLLVFDTDAARPQIYDGSAWGFGEFFNVRDFGAKGDGATNDYTAIQAALTAAASAGGGVVFFPEGTYMIGTVLTVSNNTTVAGVGASSIIKQTAGFNGPAIQNNDTVSGNTTICLRDLKVDGNKQNGVNIAGAWGIYFTRVTYSSIENVTVTSARSDGIALEYCKFTTVRNCVVTSCNKPGIYLSGSDRCKVIDNVMASNLLCGISVGSGWYNVISGNHASGHSSGDIALGRDSQYNVVSSNCVSFINTSGEVVGTTAGYTLPYQAEHAGSVASYDGTDATTLYSASNNVIANNIVTGGSGSAVQLVGGFGNTIENNVISQCGSYGITLNGSTKNLVRSNRISNVWQTGGPGLAILVSYNAATENALNLYLNDAGGAVVQSGCDNVIEGNYIFDTQAVQTSYGIQADATTTGTILRSNVVTVSTNPFVENNTTGRTVKFNNTFTSAGIINGQHYGTGAPASGYWNVGDIVWNTTPTAAGTLGWICVTAGTPGTWKIFGSIAA
jgi:parallel beta-helix repeat protein